VTISSWEMPASDSASPPTTAAERCGKWATKAPSLESAIGLANLTSLSRDRWP